MGKAQERNRSRASAITGTLVPLRVAGRTVKRDQPRLVGVKPEPVLREASGKHPQHAFSITTTLEHNQGIVGKTQEQRGTFQLQAHGFLEPLIEDMVQENVRK